VVKPLPRLKLQGFNNLTKSLSFNIYDVCYAASEDERRRYIEYIDEEYNADRLTQIVTDVAEIGYDRLNLLLTTQANDAARLLYSIGAQISQRLMHTSRKAGRLAFLDVSDRIYRTLFDLAKEPEAMCHPPGSQLRVSRQELARLVGCSREMAGRVLKKLQADGKLHARGKTVVVYGTR
jgi:CRP/FNR family cyclic AMP-dependent transcriptional regulator